MTEQPATEKAKKERSPSFPFISLRKAEERARNVWEKHRREPARVVTVAPTWGYQPKSSGLLQTIGALKQFGLLEDAGSGTDRKVQLTDLGRRLVADQRPGARETALKEAALRPRLFQEYCRWVNDAPSEGHRLSELELDRGFTTEAARVFLKSFDETVSYAGLSGEDGLSSNLSEPQSDDLKNPDALMPDPALAQNAARVTPPPTSIDDAPFSQRCQVFIAPGIIKTNATLRSAKEVDRLIRVLEANKALLDEGADLSA